MDIKKRIAYIITHHGIKPILAGEIARGVLLFLMAMAMNWPLVTGGFYGEDFFS